MTTDDSATPQADDRGQDADLPAAVPAGPPWPVDVIADLHAGRYPADVAGPLRRSITADPWAASVLTALDATVDELSLLPVPRMPERFASRLDAAIAGEYRAAAAVRGGSGGAAEVSGPGLPIDRSVPAPRQAVDQSFSQVRGRGAVDGEQIGAQQGGRQPGPQRQAGPPTGGSWAFRSSAGGSPSPRVPFTGPPAGSPTVLSALPPGVRSLDAARTKRRRWIGGLAAAAAVVAIGTASVVSLQHPRSTASQTATAAAPAPGSGSGGGNAVELDPGRFADALQQIEGKRPVGPLQDAGTYASCLAANSIDPSAVTGVTAVNFKGKPAAAIAARIDASHTEVVVVGPRCGIKGAADQLASETVTS